MNAIQAIGAAAAGLLVSAGAVGWAVKPRTAGRHRVTPRLVSLDELLGPREWIEFEHAPGVVRQGFNYCPPCGENTAGVLHTDGSWTCGQYTKHTQGAA